MLLGRLLSTPISASSIISVMFLTGSNYPVIGDLLRVVTRLCEDLQASTFSILFHPVREQLALVSSPATIERVWSSASAGSGSQGTDMPEFSFTPQEYITQVSDSSPNLDQYGGKKRSRNLKEKWSYLNPIMILNCDNRQCFAMFNNAMPRSASLMM